MYENRIDVNVFTKKDLLKLLKRDNIIRENIIVRGEHLDSLEGVEEIHGHFGMSEASLKSLGQLRRVKGNFWMSNFGTYSEFESLDFLVEVGGDMSLRYSNIRCLGKLEKVGGNLSLRDTPIVDLGVLKLIGGNLFLPKRFEGQIDLSGIKIKGNVRFWKDVEGRTGPRPRSERGLAKSAIPIPFWEHQYTFSAQDIESGNAEQRSFYKYFKQEFLAGRAIDDEGNDNYTFILMYDLFDQYSIHHDLTRIGEQVERIGRCYPKVKGYAKRLHIKALGFAGEHENAWKTTILGQRFISLITIYDFQKRLGRTVFDGALITRVAGYSFLTPFGRNNIAEIQEMATKELLKFEEHHKRHFLDVFFKRFSVDKYGNQSLHGHPSEYYRPFYLSPAEFEFWAKLDAEQEEKKLSKSITHVSEKAVISQLRQFLLNAEDAYRETIGMPKVGEGWISETELYYRIKCHLKHLEIIQHARPKWLGQQSFDVFIPALNVAIEYQGVQHFIPVDVFGGQAGLEKNIERDVRKLHLAKENECSLIYVYEGYKFEEVRQTIDQILLRNGIGCEVRHINRPREAERYLD